MKKILLAGLGLFLVSVVYGGTVRDVKGSVELLVQNKWTAAVVGQEVADGTKIMTGVGSSITVDTKGGYFTVKELSMATYGEKTTDKQVDQKVALDVGKVRVRFKKLDGVKSSFKVSTPKGTASVRGTEKDIGYYPGAGMTVFVVEGSVDVTDNSGSSFIAGQNQQSGVGNNGEIYGDNDNGEDNSGYNNQFGDNDADTAGGQVGDLMDQGPGQQADRPDDTVDLEKL